MSYHAAAPKKRTGRRLAEDPSLPEEPEWVPLARRLRRHQRWSYQHIADHLREIGAIAPQVPAPAAYRRVYKALNRERVRETDAKNRAARADHIRERTIEYRNRIAPRCSVCGQKLWKPPKALPPVCRDCRLRAGARRKAAIAGLALAGWTPKQISEQLGIDANSVSTTVSVMRKEGIPIPYKRKPRGRESSE